MVGEIPFIALPQGSECGIDALGAVGGCYYLDIEPVGHSQQVREDVLQDCVVQAVFYLVDEQHSTTGRAHGYSD